MVYQTEKQLKEHADKIPAEVKSQIETAVSKLKKEIESENVPGMKAAMEELEALLQKIGEAVYASQQQQQQQGAAGPSADAGAGSSKKSDDDEGVVDAEVVE